jgi:hypothetical protein
MEVHIGMAVQPLRFKNLNKSLPILTKQCDKLWVVINSDESISDLPPILDEYTNLEIIVNKKNKGDAEKFLGMTYLDSGYYLTADDDILYPEDYVETHLKYNSYFERIITTVHAKFFDPRELNTNIKKINYLQGRHFENDSKYFEKVLMCGTGTTCFNVKYFKMLPNEMLISNMSDVWISVKAAQMGVPIFSIPRNKNWLKQLSTGGSTIFKNKSYKKMINVLYKNKSHLFKMWKRINAFDPIIPKFPN